MLKINFPLITGSLLLAGCSALGPNYQRPSLELPSILSVSATPTTTAIDWVNWSKSFQDPVLERLFAEAAVDNQDLVLAAGRVEEARAAVDTVVSNRYPVIDATLSSSKTRSSQDTGKLPAGVNPVAKDFYIGLNASYEVDFWGKLSRADEAARARMLSLKANRGVVQASLYSNLTQTYFALRSFDAQLVLAETTLQTRLENVRLQKKRFSAGLVGELDLHQATSEVSAAEVAVAQARQSVANAESALATLLGRSPAAIVTPVIVRGADIATLHGNLMLPTDLPSDLLNRRPDILAAEQNLIAANADIAQARAQFFPNVKLVNGIGYESNALRSLVNPSSLLWNFGANLVQPIFRAGGIGSAVEGAKARQTQALAQYVQVVQNAFRDVHDALANLSADEQVKAATTRRVTVLKETLRLALLRYENGYSSFLEVLNAQRDLFQTQASLIDIQRAHLSAAVSLYKAVGNGWEIPENLATK